MQGAGGVGTLNKQLGQAVEGRDGELLAVLRAGMVETRIRRIAIAGTEDAAVARKGEGELRAGVWDDTTFLVLYLDGDDGEVATVGGNLAAVCLEHGLKGGFRGFDGLGENALAVFIAVGDDTTWLIGGVPLEVAVLGHRLTTNILSVDDEFHLVAVAISVVVVVLIDSISFIVIVLFTLSISS